MRNDMHPLLKEERPSIITRPAERMALDAANAIQMGDHALWITGSAQVGKTWGARLLMTTTKWRPFPMTMFETSFTKPKNPSEIYFANSFLLQHHQKLASRSVSIDSMIRTVNYMREAAARDSSKLVGLIINDTNRFTREDYEHLMSLDNLAEKQIRLFFFLINQDDAQGYVPGQIDKRPPRHLFSRYFNNTHEYTGLLWDIPEADKPDQTASDVALALLEYDEILKWPKDTEMSYSRYFAQGAWDSGWRMGMQIDLIREEIEELRKSYGLAPSTNWRMKTFEKFVYYMLVRIANQTQNFREFSRAQIKDGLRRSGYIELETTHDMPQDKGDN